MIIINRVEKRSSLVLQNFAYSKAVRHQRGNSRTEASDSKLDVSSFPCRSRLLICRVKVLTGIGCWNMYLLRSGLPRSTGDLATTTHLPVASQSLRELGPLADIRSFPIEYIDRHRDDNRDEPQDCRRPFKVQFTNV